MQRYTYRLLKFSELEGQYRGSTYAEEKLEQRVNQELNSLAVEGWMVQNFTVHYTGGRLIYTVLLNREINGSGQVAEVAAVPVQSREAVAPTMPVPASTATNGSEPKRRPSDATTELRPLGQGPTIGERANEIKRNIEAQYGPDYFGRALASFDINLKARGEQEKIPAEAIAIRALRHRDQKHEVTFQFALCWLSEHGYANRPLSSLVPGTVQLSPSDDASKTQPVSNQAIQPPRLTPPQAIKDSMAGRFDLPDQSKPR